jgi:hypothetical protein
MDDDIILDATFSYRFGQKVKIRAPHPEAGATGPVTNAYLFRDGREEVFVSVPGGVGIYHASELEPAGPLKIAVRRHSSHQPGNSTLSGGNANGNGAGLSGEASGA